MIRLTADLPTLDFAKTDDDAPASISGIAVPWAPNYRSSERWAESRVCSRCF
jgi:hypothetical protein